MQYSQFIYSYISFCTWTFFSEVIVTFSCQTEATYRSHSSSFADEMQLHMFLFCFVLSDIFIIYLFVYSQGCRVSGVSLLRGLQMWRKSRDHKRPCDMNSGSNLEAVITSYSHNPKKTKTKPTGSLWARWVSLPGSNAPGWDFDSTCQIPPRVCWCAAEATAEVFMPHAKHADEKLLHKFLIRTR